jgi:hypothetical protein
MHVDLGHGSITIQGITCYLPKMPDKFEMLNYGLKKSQQKWKRTELPIFSVRDIDIWDGTDYKPDDVITWPEAVRQEHIKIYGTDPYDLDRQGNPKRVEGVIPDPDYSMDCLNSFREQELDRVYNGVWILINGNPYYLPGSLYLYLNYWELKDGFAEWRYTDLELFYVWEHVRKSKNFLGIVYITMRGVGKSYIAGCIDYYETITHKKANTTIQSKSDDDAADFFRDKILIPVSRLPEFLVPIHKHVGDITSLSTLEFVPPSRKQMNVRMYNKLKETALYSKMQYTNSGEYAADGPTWDLLVQEEIGKTDPASVADVYKRLIVNQFTVFRGNKKMGNIYASSTVEEMKVGGAECLKIWNESNQYKLNSLSMTNTGLVRFFRSALDTTFFDEFGFPDRVKAKEWHDAKRDSLKHDQKALIAYIQKNPYNEREAFWIDADKCVYNAEILFEVRDRLENKSMTRRGDFVWKEKDKEAMWVDNDISGRWEVSMLLDKEEANQVKIDTDSDGKKRFSPLMGHKRVMAMDPFASETVVDEDAGSDAAAAVYNKFDYNTADDFCDTFIADYVFRPDTPQEAVEDILIAAWYYGCPVLFETNRGDTGYYCKLRGYKWGGDANEEDFYMERPESTYTKESQTSSDGIYATEGIKTQYVNTTAAWVVNRGKTLKHLRICYQFIAFQPKKSKKYDLGVASSLSLIAAEKKIQPPKKAIDLSGMFKTWNNTGTHSSLN